MTSSTATTLARSGEPLVRLLGEVRATIVSELREHGDRAVAQLAELLQISEVATRRHLAVLEDEGFVVARTVRQARGRPAAHYELTEDAQRLFPHRYDQLASEVLDFLTEQQGREGLRAFLRWRLDREAADLRDAVTAEDLHERLEQLAATLSDAGFAADVEPTDDGYRLVQNHCAIADVAKEHPEVCAYEAAAFAKVLGRGVTLSRRDTLAKGAQSCVCSVTAAPTRPFDDADASTRPDPAGPHDPAASPDTLEATATHQATTGT